MKLKFHNIIVVLALLAGISQAWAQSPLGTTFTYQGRLETNGVPANGFYDFEFALYTNAAGTGTQVGSTITQTGLGVTNGLFTTSLNFGDVFTGYATWLSISARSNLTGSYTALTPLQELTPAPYAIFADTSSNLSGTLDADRLTGTLPAGVLSGTYGDALTISNASDTFAGNGAGLNSLNASALATGVVPDGVLNPDVALLDRSPQTFTGANTFTSGGSTIGFIVNSPGTSTVDTNLFTGLSLQYAQFSGEGAMMAAFNSGPGGDGFLSFYTKALGAPISRQVMIDYYGGVAIDQQNANSGVINNGTTNGVGLTFGISSGEGLASQRTATGGNQYGLDFYTDFNQRMSITQQGYVGIGRNTPIVGDDWLDVHAPVTNGYGGMYVETAGTGYPFYGYAMDDGVYAYTWVWGTYNNSWNVYDDGADLTLTPSGQLGVNTYYPSQALEVSGNYALIDGASAYNGNGLIEAYIGGNGSGSDVQIGSMNSSIGNIGFWNTGSGTYMHIYCSAITINGGSDLAEPFAVSSPSGDIPQGSVVVIDEENPGHLKVSSQPYDTRVAGVLSGANGINPGIQMQQQGLLEGGKNVALTGRVYVLADASNGAINPGDLLTTSAAPGHAMKVSDHARASGAILGKAMSGLKEGKGMVLVLVTLQ